VATGDFLDISQRACRLARRDETITAQVTLAKEAVNEGYQVVLAAGDDWDFLYREGSASLAAGTDTRTLAQLESDLAVAGTDDIEDITDIADDTNGRPITAMPWRALENLARTTQSVTTNGFPEYWSVSSDRVVRYWPRPLTATTMRYRYRLRPGLMTTDAAVPLIPALFAAVILEHYAAYKLLLQDTGGEAISEAQVHLQMYDRTLAKLMQKHGSTRDPLMGLVEPAAFDDLPDIDPMYYQGAN
jgi:hypothetical protein